MAYDEDLAARIRDELAPVADITEKKMFGGISFLLSGNMAVGVIGDEMCVRVGPEEFDELLDEPGARIFDFSGRPMKGWLMVGDAGQDDGAAFVRWIGRGVEFAGSLPPKSSLRPSAGRGCG